VLLSDDTSVALHQFVTGSWTADVAGGAARLAVSTDYPWQGSVRVQVEDAPGQPWTLALRVPGWADGATVTVNGQAAEGGPVDGWWRTERTWEAGDDVVLQLPLEPRLTAADPRLDAARGCVAVERGPLVYCLEGVDHEGHRLDDVRLELAEPLEAVAEKGALGPVVLVRASGTAVGRPSTDWWPYGAVTQVEATPEEAVPLTAVPYFAWGNRGEGAMRIWVPTA
jgi:DUF1680 family protein